MCYLTPEELKPGTLIKATVHFAWSWECGHCKKSAQANHRSWPLEELAEEIGGNPWWNASSKVPFPITVTCEFCSTRHEAIRESDPTEHAHRVIGWDEFAAEVLGVTTA